jgi:hypothetical protein
VLNPDYRDMLSLFAETSVDYLVVGAYALAAHGLPRATGDIDLWVRPTPENAERVLAALKRFGAPLFDLTVADLSKPGIVFQIGVVPRRIDILTLVSGLEFDAAWQERHEIALEGLTIPVLSRSDLLKNKKAAGRPKDIADVAWLEGRSG